MIQKSTVIPSSLMVLYVPINGSTVVVEVVALSVSSLSCQLYISIRIYMLVSGGGGEARLALSHISCSWEVVDAGPGPPLD